MTRDRQPRRSHPPAAEFPHRRTTYLIERLPGRARRLVDRGLAQGKSYRAICEELARLGLTVSLDAVSHYWRSRWRYHQRRLDWLKAQVEALSQMLRHTGESHEALLARKLLFTALLDRMSEFKRAEVFDLLRETREMVKATKHLDAAPAEGTAKKRRPMSRAEMRRRIREIYGWPEEKPTPEVEPEPPAGDAPAN